jgi:ferredoxin-NADP reductase
VRLIANERETPTTRRVRLAVNGDSFRYRAGQAAALLIDSTEATPYSIASAPSETAREGWIEFLVKVDGSTRFGASVDTLTAGTRIDVTGPVGAFTADGVPSGAPMLFVAGGTGIAPLRSMIRQAVDEGHRGPLSLVYSSRTPDEFAYLADLQELSEAGRLALTLTLTGASDDWLHARGRAGIGHLSRHVEPGLVAFVCGPPAMVLEIPAALASLGVTRDRTRTENW